MSKMEVICDKYVNALKQTDRTYPLFALKLVLKQHAVIYLRISDAL